MDNAKFHHSHAIKNLLAEYNINFQYLPPYSFKLNPIEEVFGTIKARYSSGDNRPNNSLELIGKINEIILGVNDSVNFENHYGHMRYYLNLAYQGIWF